MPRRGTGLARPAITEWPGGFTWISYPEEDLQRASHALIGKNGVWLVDPVDFEGLDDRLREVGGLVGIAVLLERHTRDADTIAARHDVSISLPIWMDGVAETLDTPVVRFDRTLGDSGFRAKTILNNRFWQECALWDGDTLIVPEAMGSSAFFTVDSERLGVAPALRLFPPRRQLGGLNPTRVLTGHGRGVFENAGQALDDALTGSRRRAPRLYLNVLRMLLP